MRILSALTLLICLFAPTPSLAEDESEFFELVATVKSTNSRTAVFVDNETHYVVVPGEYETFTVKSIGDAVVTLVDENGPHERFLGIVDAPMPRVEQKTVKIDSKETWLWVLMETVAWKWGKGLLLHPTIGVDSVEFGFEGSPRTAFEELMKTLNGRLVSLETGDNLLVGPESELDKMRQSLSGIGAKVSVEAQSVPLGALTTAIARADGKDYWVSPSLMAYEDEWGGGSLKNVSSQGAASAIFFITYSGFKALAREDFQAFGTAEEVEAAMTVSNSSDHKLSDFDYHLADLTYVYRVSAQKMEKDLLLSPSVEGTVTLKLRQASLERLLTLALIGQKSDPRLFYKRDTIMIGNQDERERLRAALAAAGDYGPLVSVDYINVELGYFCGDLAKRMGLTLKMDENIEGSASVFFRDRKAEEVLALVLASQTPPCDYKIEGKNLLITR